MRARTAAVAAVLSLTGSFVAASPAAGAATAVYYLKPQVTTLDAATDKCPGDAQWFVDKEARIAWTWTNGRHACVEVSYTPRYTSMSCDFSFYIPPKSATAVVRFAIHGDFDPRIHGGVVRGPGLPVDEKPRHGWWHIGRGTNVRSILFTDANGQPYRAERIGWGMDATNGIKQVCAPERRRPL
ncbi:hypothetical protein E1292_13335 [Nonomuraea deserti]|uniref:Uncharacterized protein n=1 Tax=Nonomuraea deserti TaxID=1848322 RepID=A0A4R4VVU9_9ACTN|nr:hypothetical protein [Nonomuraea deserti]TDD07483.1 hypothetical protein E1292_13335 [Nonomuraea deserti]